MWTPKRIVMLAIGFVVFALLYAGYSLTFLGRINTLPPLPEQYRFDANTAGENVLRPKSFKPTPLEQKLEQAFFKGCDELGWPVRLELSSKSMVLAARDFRIEDDGRVKLESMSLALFGKKKNERGEVEINTLRCKQAYVTFDQPITSFSPSEMNGRKIVEAELFGDAQTRILITNNRRTPQRDDDLTVTINTGPLYYQEKKQLIWTNDAVYLMDGQLPVPKAVVNAEGMEMELMNAGPPPKPGSAAAAKAKNDSVSGVKRIHLKRNVIMDLLVASGMPLPGGDKSKPAPSGKDAPAPKPSTIYIRTPGSFEYQFFKDYDLARFDVPEDGGPAGSPRDVTVERHNKQLDTHDVLVCKHLELRLKHRGDTPPPPGAPPTPPSSATSPEQGLEIETAYATGPDVTLTSDAEKLDAHGNEFFYDTTKKLTILRGTPFVEANKEDSIIQAPELRIQDIPLPAPASASVASGDKAANGPPKTFQQIQATGPGSIHVANKTTNKRTVHAYWNEKLLSTRDGTLDLLILVGAARFVDEEHEQSLSAETLKVWLLAEDKKPAAAVKAPAPKGNAPATPESSRRPQRIDAQRNVLARSPTLIIHDAARFIVRFTDVPASRLPPPNNGGDKLGIGGHSPLQPSPTRGEGAKAAGPLAGQAATSPPPGRQGTTSPSPLVGEGGGGGKTVSSAVVGKPTPAPPVEPARPIDLTASSIEAEVLRCEERLVLDRLWAEGGPIDNIDKRGGVRVIQEAEKPSKDSKEVKEGVYVEGYTLDMRCYPDGNVLVVTGDLAQLKMDKIIILGPEVHIDQVQNKSWVIGNGAMQMQSNSTLEGKPLDRTVPLKVYWSRDMVFWGDRAQFLENVQAEQENAHLACQSLQVYFDKPLSLKEGSRGGPPPKVRNLVGDKDVRVEDYSWQGDKLAKYQRLDGTAIAMNTEPRDDEETRPSEKAKDASLVTLSGPGTVRLLQRGGADAMPLPAPGKPTPARSPSAPLGEQDQVMKLTYVSFEKLMRASTRTNVASFWGSVRVLNLPCDDPHADIDLDDILSRELPPGAMYLRCDRLWVRSYQKKSKNYQEMEAKGQVVVQDQEITAQCDHLTFNEEKDQVIFLGEGDNKAVLSKVVLKGQPPKTFRAHKIIYYRTTGQVDVDRIDSIDG